MRPWIIWATGLLADSVAVVQVVMSTGAHVPVGYSLTDTAPAR